MRWRGRRKSSNIEDRRGSGFNGNSRGRTLGGGAMVLVVLAGLFFGQDVQNILGLLLNTGGSSVTQQTNSSGGRQTAAQSGQQDEASQLVSVILAETEDTWSKVFQQLGKRYQPPTLVLYNDRVKSACGTSSAASGPFYCPGDQQVYIDLSFLEELRLMGAPGDFAFAYVIAHEVGHHVQNLVGVAGQVRDQQRQASKVQANALSVRMELQADCLAGVWINHTENRNSILEQGDIKEGLSAAAAVGDDRIMKKAGREVRREAFTHGSSAERIKWFKQGMQTGDLQSCNTFG
ncbi:MAG: putative metalloprotease [Arenicella sp.]|jgi:predicted metalloprotease